MENYEEIVHYANDISCIIAGDNDQYLRLLEDEFSIEIIPRGNTFLIKGHKNQIEKTKNIMIQISELYATQQQLDYKDISALINLYSENSRDDANSVVRDTIIVGYRGKNIRPKTKGQKMYIDDMRKHDIVFSIGPAGTGKTFLAIAMAVVALNKRECNKIILTRPAVEAGERLGFLPGDLQDKVDPYLRPLYDSLTVILGPEKFSKNLERGIIEVAPLAYMRGRTLEEAFIILDEAQNTTCEQMKMFLTRMGFGSKVVVTGDTTQIDLPMCKPSGLIDAVKKLEGIANIAVRRLGSEDVVRHPLVQDIINAYASWEHKKEHLFNE